MATFTMTLKQAISLQTDSDHIGDQAAAIGLDTYPLFNESYRDELNRKIINRYWNQEIGFETVSMFKHYMSARMFEIMPLYNQYYESQAKEIDPFKTFDITTLNTSEVTSSSEGNRVQSGETLSEADSTTISKARAIGSEFPQMSLSGNEDYATSGSDTIGETGSDTVGKDSSTAESTDNTIANQEGESTTHVSGHQGSMADMLLKYRQTFMNIDIQIIDELEDLFMSIWSTTEPYSSNWSY